MTVRKVRGARVFECQFCGALEGDVAAVREVHQERDAARRGMDPLVYPLVEALERMPHLRVREASAGASEECIPPYVQFHVEERNGALRHIERLLQSLEMSHRRTRRIWALEAHYTHSELRFALRPRFMKPVGDLDPDEIRDAQLDLRLLAERLERDMGLSWWA
ncbi:MAG: hypothetical protein JXQ29_08900 [Planctomycetes bacterium]|nr:hypothetical protein [Planctomycetota bacterium]